LEHFMNVLKKYAEFSGRARRQEYWMFTLIYILMYAGLAVVEGMILGTPFISSIFLLAMFLPTISVAIRRLHDTGRSGWWLLLSLIPIVSIVLVVFMCLDSEEGDNDYGPNPKA
jgi:uncharacterized membrane protein YhaH (DUF805 family)